MLGRSLALGRLKNGTEREGRFRVACFDARDGMTWGAIDPFPPLRSQGEVLTPTIEAILPATAHEQSRHVLLAPSPMGRGLG